MIGGGAYIKNSTTSDVINMNGGLAVAAIIIGVIITIISFFGCFGAANEKGVLLKTYFAMLFILVILELSIGIAAIAKKDDVSSSTSLVLS